VSSAVQGIAGLAGDRDTHFDVVIVGSGGAGLSAALAAAGLGAKVAVLEKTPWLGGTTAISGGTCWIPANHLAEQAGLPDSAEEAFGYLCAGGGDTINRPLLRRFSDEADRVLRFIETHSPARFTLGKDGDYHSEIPGGKEIGRSVIPTPFDPASLGTWASRVRATSLPLDIAEIYGSLNWSAHAAHAPVQDPQREYWTRGRSLIGSLLAGCLAAGVRVLTEHRAIQLAADRGRVTGVLCEASAGMSIAARRGVVLTCGGFEWDAALTHAFLGASLEAPASPPSMEGDGLRMAMAMGASLDSMSEAWWSPMLKIPGETYEGRPHSRMAVSQRLYPRSIIVNKAGERFMNEATSYHDAGGKLKTVDHSKGGPAHCPAWLIFDHKYRMKYGIASVGPHDPDPDWLRPYASLADLSQGASIDPALLHTIRSFNRHAEEGRDPAFRRGENPYALSKGDRANDGALRTLGPINAPPYYAVRLYAGTIGTRGGPSVDESGRVLDVWGSPIPGLYAAGNVAASPTGLLYPGAGGTLGLALTFGHLAGAAAAAGTPMAS
jgi:3-oxosteroid 1-dehydrogenase